MPPSSGKVTNAMELSDLQTHIRTLITLEADEAPIISCYVHCAIGRNGSGDPLFEQRVRAIRKVLGGQPLDHFEEAFERIMRYLTTEVRLATQGVATFARAGTQPFFLGLQFQVPLPDRLSVGSTPDIYHLVELKDTYHRYVVLISTEERARILEVNLGAITREVWAERPELRERVGREWTREHYQNHRRDRGKRFLKEKFEILEKLMAAGGHTHLILAGNPRMTARIRNCLPKHLQAKLIDVVPASANARVADVVEATLSTFIDREQQESLDAVAELMSGLRRGGLGAAGTAATLEALRQGQADLLVMARDYEPGPAWGCTHCGWANAMTSRPDRCAECDSSEMQSVNLKEVMVKLAERQSLEVEVVEHSDVLMDLGGVGCLLRYATPEPSRSAL
jgi:protein required for attachment to host cells